MRLSSAICTLAIGFSICTVGFTAESAISTISSKTHSTVVNAATRVYFDALSQTWRTESITTDQQTAGAGFILRRPDYNRMQRIVLPDGTQGVMTNGQVQMSIGEHRDANGVAHEICLPTTTETSDISTVE